ncbi:type II toxin-antitoxin system HipA family toxin [Tenacibaculum retecalamus]|uniref:type II toxin-antitoxin system HipA family toxin n=1 Tax=Tenacibaculum retecalamus TaxID=3018315 RepID=UPI0023D93E67|nr:type II toxin-antitoxin system HipA family toxin [Tenacibaculum retecalamus]WBX71203.1 type II toxin-antitoxin system HipA family toxin [Tenacibaculum retecalamus]
MATTKLNVYIQFSKEEELIGELVLDGRDILFKYSDAYLEVGKNLSPNQLMFNDTPQTTKEKPFNGLFGVFADSLPDAWGYLLIKKRLSTNRVAIESLNALDHLTFAGKNSMGALQYRPSVALEQEAVEINLDKLKDNVSEVISGESSAIIDDMFGRGGSPGGARPKIYAGYNPKTDSLISGVANLPEEYEHWIIKFAADVDSKDIANIELTYYKMALDSGIEMSECRVFTSNSGNSYFGTKRFDRIGNDKLQMLSAAGLLNDDYEHSTIDYGNLIYQAKKLTNNAQAAEQMFRRAVFNILVHNRDDHSKNFAFLMNAEGEWSLAPAYDLTFSSSSQGYHSTSCAKNYVDPGKKELLELASALSIKKAKIIIDEIKEVTNQWKRYAVLYRVSEASTKTIEASLKTIRTRF